MEPTLQTMHVSGSSWLKRMKRYFTGKGATMELYEQIEIAAYTGNREDLFALLSFLRRSVPNSWQPQYHKILELIAFCQYLLVSPQNLVEKRAARFRLELALDTSHEIGRKIQAFLNASATPK